MQAKDCMFKATRGVVREMYFTDDGFGLGIAYCLAILKQTRKFEALHWVDTVRSKFKVSRIPSLGLSLSLSLRLLFIVGLFLYTVGISFHVEWCIR